MIFIPRSQEPSVLQNRGKAERQTLCEAYDAGKREFKFDSAIYGHETVILDADLLPLDQVGE